MDIIEQIEAAHASKAPWPKIEKLMAQAADDFGAARGWKRTTSGIGLGFIVNWPRGLGPMQRYASLPVARGLVDHPFCYRLGRRSHALVAHSYMKPDELREGAAEIAEKYGLDVEFPEVASWWNPGAATVVVYKRTDRVAHIDFD
jgi:hypothetical protein